MNACTHVDKLVESVWPFVHLIIWDICLVNENNTLSMMCHNVNSTILKLGNTTAVTIGYIPIYRQPVLFLVSLNESA